MTKMVYNSHSQVQFTWQSNTFAQKIGEQNQLFSLTIYNLEPEYPYEKLNVSARLMVTEDYLFDGVDDMEGNISSAVSLGPYKDIYEEKIEETKKIQKYIS